MGGTMEEKNDREKRDAMCPECGHAFSVFVDRLVKSESEREEPMAACPVCGCSQCRIGK